MKKNIKKTLSVILSSLSLGVASIAVSSCSSRTVKDNDYDFGYAMSPVNTLNYVRSEGTTSRIAPTLVQGLLRTAPDQKYRLNRIPEFKLMQLYDKPIGFPTIIGKGTYEYDLSKTGLIAGNIGESQSFGYTENPQTGDITSLVCLLNGKQKWKGAADEKFNRTVYAKDYIDYVKYIMDLGNGSEKVTKIRQLHIKGIDELYHAQVEYSEVFNDVYKYPFGKDVYASNRKIYFDDKYQDESEIPLSGKRQPGSNDVRDILIENEVDKTEKTKENYWPLQHQTPSQATKEKEIVAKIRKSAIEFMTSGMFTFSQNVMWKPRNGWVWNNPEEKFEFSGDFQAGMTDEEIRIKSQEIREDNRQKNLKIEFTNEADSTVTTYQSMQHLFPVNKEFIESVGGIYNFGRTLKEFIYSSAFNIEDIRLGQGGYISLVKDYNWYNSKNTASDRVKVYFQDDPNVISSWFEDGYVSQANMPSVFQKSYWTRLDFRKYMSRQPGFGTVVIQMNIDNKDSKLNNEHLRNAINHAINRADLLKLMNWGASIPVATWTPSGLVHSKDGRVIDRFFDIERYKPELSNEEIPLNAVPWSDQQGMDYLFENIDRSDKKHDVELARKYFEEFKKETGLNSVTLSFLCDSAPNEKAGLGIRSLLKDVFNGEVEIDVKRVPSAAYQTYIHQGKFELTIATFDEYGMSASSFWSHLIFPDLPSDSSSVSSAYFENPTGGWTLSSWYKEKFVDGYSTAEETKKALEKFAKEKLLINTDEEKEIFNYLVKQILELNPINNDGSYNETLRENFKEIFRAHKDPINSDEDLFKLMAILEKIVAIANPIIPLAEVDNSWIISRLNGVPAAAYINLEFGYDSMNKPNPRLP